MTGRRVSLEDRYELRDGLAFMAGVQAIVRAILDQRRADEREGLRTGAFVSGYPGSPIAGFDRELQRARSLLGDLGIVHNPGLNEELGATSVWGTQMLGNIPRATVEGVLGVWYGKAPGLDRSGDAMRHANYAGTHPRGGALVAVGEDPGCKSSTVPSEVEGTLADLLMPTFVPGNVQEILDLALHAIACSRMSGAWSALKLATNVIDGAGTVMLAEEQIAIAAPPGWEEHAYAHRPRADLTAPVVLGLEQALFETRLPLAAAYATHNGVNRVTRGGPGDWLGVVAAGKTYYEVRQALADLGLGDAELERAGVRLLKLGMVFPVDRRLIRDFANGLEEIVVVEDKLPFIERDVRDALYGTADAPRVLGKRDEDGRAFLSPAGELYSGAIAFALGERLGRRVSLDSVDAHLAFLAEHAEVLADADRPSLARTPFFCSGCPHNSSTVADPDAVVGAGIGCHAMVLLAPEGKGKLAGLTQMGGEGAQWIGMAPFTDTEHFVQNLGDGTFHHSGSLGIRAAVAAGVNITFKLLYNGAVAMTGGQAIPGTMTVRELTEWLALEGVKRTIVTAEEPERYAGVTLAANAELRGRDQLLRAQRDLSAVEGVTVLIHDQQCAAEKRRLRKRGRMEEPRQRIHINERVCEGCGDCGRKSSCLSVQPVETEYGRKTQIHQASCNKDFSCLKGDCPSFLTIVPGAAGERPAIPAPPAGLPDPAPAVPAHDFSVRMVGIGGTGVVTVSQILGVAALIDGRHVWALDQTGLSQKGGPVLSDLRIAEQPVTGSNRVGAGRADVLLAYDLLGASTPENLLCADPERTLSVVSTAVIPTGEMIVDTGASFPGVDAAVDAIAARTRPGGHRLDAQALALALFDDHMPANMILLGAAFQRGALPLSAAAFEEAIRLNGAAVEANLAAFAWGRASVAAPEAVAARLPQALVEPADVDTLIARRGADLADYQSARYARAYRAFVDEVRAREAAVTPGGEAITEAVARNLHKLMAYKDEYEVARLHLDPAERAIVRERFGAGAKVAYNLHPPLLRALGMDRKIALGEWFDPAFRALRAGKRLRGTALDPFGRAKVRRIERELVGEYKADVRAALALLTPATAERVAQLAELPDMVRGYEEIKLANVDAYRLAVREALEALRAPADPPIVVMHR